MATLILSIKHRANTTQGKREKIFGRGSVKHFVVYQVGGIGGTPLPHPTQKVLYIIKKSIII